VGLRKACYKRLMVRWFKPVVFLACLGPLARLGWKAYMGLLGANPIEVITHSTGDWILILPAGDTVHHSVCAADGQLWLTAIAACSGCSHSSTQCCTS